MDKTRINIDVLLPEIPHERDECVNRVIRAVTSERGIEEVHIIPQTSSEKAQLCFHYNPDEINLEKVQSLAEHAGVEITERYGHLSLEVKGIRHVRHARLIETELKDVKGIVTASASAAGWITIEYDHHLVTPKKIYATLGKLGIAVLSPQLKSIPGHKHVHTEEAHHSHDHEHGHGIFGEKSELIFAIICGIFLAIGFALSFIKAVPFYVPIASYIIAYFFGGFYTSKEAVQGILNGDFEIDFLMLVAAIGAAVLGHWAEGALLLFLFSLGHSLEHYAMAKAKKSIASLAGLTPKTALLKTGNTIREVKIEHLKPGDVIVTRPNSKIAADGIVIRGNSSVNEAPITGESIPSDKTPVEDENILPSNAEKLDATHKVFAGTINGGQNLEIKVTKIAADSTIARLVKMVHEAQTQKSPTQNFTDKVEKYYVPAVLILVTILLFAWLIIDEPFSASFYRAMSVLVAASPCALAISTPSAVLSGVARAARGGVLIKGGKPLEELGSVNAIAFDKTGTLTEGKPKLTGIFPLNNFPEEKLLEVAVAVEKLVDHPLAAAVVRGGMEKLMREVEAATDVTTIHGRGVSAIFQREEIHIGNKELFTEKRNYLPEDIRQKVESLEELGNTTMIVQQNDSYIGIITLMDVARADAKETIEKLKTEGISKIIMLTGDNQKVADAIGKEIGITEAWGNLLPAQKLDAIEKLKGTEKKIAMVGDGVNDAPAMAKSTVGIAMGAAGSDVALETADIALMADKLNNLPFAIALSKKAHRIIRQNLVISLGMVALLLPLTLLGIAHIGPAVVGHEGSTLLVVFNALRLLAFKK